MEQTDSCQRKGGHREWWKEGEGINQRMCVNHPWTWTTVWELTVGAGVEMGGGGQRGENCDNCNRVNKNLEKKKLH